jgi:hypothetical protein
MGKRMVILTRRLIERISLSFLIRNNEIEDCEKDMAGFWDIVAEYYTEGK